MIDCHQHLWPPAFIDTLRRRNSAPYMADDMLFLDGEKPYRIDPELHNVTARQKCELNEDKELVLLSLSSPLGIEYLPLKDAQLIIDSWHTCALELPAPFGLWISASVIEPDLKAVQSLLTDRRVAGLQVPATAMSHPNELDKLGDLLQIVQASGKPVFVHPGPVVAHDREDPPWWTPVVPYVGQQHAAWYAWHTAGRAQHPSLKLCFAALAGLAPLHHERLVARGGTFSNIDPYVYYENSSYGTRAVDAMIRVVGVDAIVLGSDRPYAEPTDPGLGKAFTQALFSKNPRHLLKGVHR